MALTVTLPKLPVASEGTPRNARGIQLKRGARTARTAREEPLTPSLPAAAQRKEASVEAADLRLSQYFDSWGQPRSRRLGVSFVAKQSVQLGKSFGSRSRLIEGAEGAPIRRTAQTFFCAEEARQKDFETTQQKTKELLDSIEDARRYQVEDVQRRQLEVLFHEVADFQRFFPGEVPQAAVLPVDLDAEEELRNRREADRSLGFLTDPFWYRGKEMKWALNRNGAILLWQVALLWMHAAWGPGPHPGIDRPSFCRFLLDCGLIDQRKVPLFWAVSLFDDVAKPMRLFTSEFSAMHLPLLQALASWWDFVSILDTILQQHFEMKIPQAFLRSLYPIAKMRLPAHVIEASALNDQIVGEIIRGETRTNSFWSEGFDETDAESELPRPDLASVSQEEIHRAETIRDWVVKLLLIEPEVLHLVTQHQELLQRLYACYADDQGEMDFEMLLQFCVDFHLSPALVPTRFVHRAFESTRCVSLRPMEPSKPAVQATLRRGGRAPTSKFGSAVSRKDSNGSNKPGTSGSRSSSRRSSLASLAGLPTRANPAAAHHAAGADGSDLPWRSVAKIAEQAAFHKEPVDGYSHCPTVFGFSAFVEALCFIAFSYLGYYGNMQQKSMSGLARIVWLMTYLSQVVTNLQQGIRRQALLEDSPLAQALQVLPPGQELWIAAPPTGLSLSQTVLRLSVQEVEARRKPPEPARRSHEESIARSVSDTVEDDSPLSPNRMRRELSSNPKHGSSKSMFDWSSVKDSHETGNSESSLAVQHTSSSESPLPVSPRPSGRWGAQGTPCVEREVCKVCKGRVPANKWGNPRCHGCSVVDMMNFKDHLFKPLLLDWPTSLKPARLVGYWPSKLPRSVLAPPTVCRSDSLRH